MIIRGTTPTITYTFKTVNVTDLAVANMTLRQGCLEITKEITDATVVHSESENYLEWTLTQAETLSINEECNIRVQCRWKTTGGIVGASPITDTSPYAILKDGEI